MSLPLSAFIICQDEELYIEACIRSLHMCAEIVVVDSGSKDRTLEILEGLKGLGQSFRDGRGEGSGLHAVLLAKDGKLVGAADSRRDGVARGP